MSKRKPALAVHHSELLNYGFTAVNRADARDGRILSTDYTMYVGWFRIRVVLPALDGGKPRLRFALRLVPCVASWTKEDQWLDWTSHCANPTVHSVVDNAIGFYRVVRAD